MMYRLSVFGMTSTVVIVLALLNYGHEALFFALIGLLLML